MTSNLPITNIFWQMNIAGTTTTITSDTNTIKYSGSTSNNPSLEIFNTDLNDTGEYTCFASNSVGTGESSVITLNVTGGENK